jgi:acyl carrier protein
MTTLQRIQECICEASGASREDITREANLFSDLGLDSLDLVEAILNIEAEFDLDIPDSAMDRFNTVQDLVSYVEEVTA